VSDARQAGPGEARPNPYVGPRAFQRGEILYGRDHEVLELLDLLIAERIVVLYSPSGAGKTSLIQAALIPELEAEHFAVLPVLRVGLKPSSDGEPSELPAAELARQPANRYVLNALLSLEDDLPPEAQLPLGELATWTLGDYLDRRAEDIVAAGRLAGRADGDLVLVFDQFEEILTADPTDVEAKAEFFAQVGTALRDRQRWALFAMREEYLAGLDPFLRPLPTRLSTTYRLDLLGPDMACQAIQEPARHAGVRFTDPAAARLVDDLRRVQVQQAGGHMMAALGEHIEPVQLQVVCRRLWDRLAANDLEIGEADVEALGHVDRALGEYYADRVAAVATQARTHERSIRQWFEQRLITEQGIRGQVLQGATTSQGLNNRAIWLLVDAHLVRAEKQRGATWFELAHDRLIGPVKADNAAWREKHLSPLQHQAALWQSQGRPEGMLLRDQALEDAERWLADHHGELMPAERDFVAACRAAAERHSLEAQVRYTGRLRKFRRLAIGEAVGFGLALTSFVLLMANVAPSSALECLLFPSLIGGIVCAVWAVVASVQLSTVQLQDTGGGRRKGRLAWWRNRKERG
jgi:hypothetical protein